MARAGRGPYNARKRNEIRDRARQMLDNGERINKSRIARELHVPIRTVFRVLPRLSII